MMTRLSGSCEEGGDVIERHDVLSSRKWGTMTRGKIEELREEGKVKG